MFEKAIVPLDGSVTAEVALPYAAEFAGRTGAELILLFVKEPHDYRAENILQCYLTNTAERVAEIAGQYFQESGISRLKVSTNILTGNPAEEIINFAESNPNSKIIMATHGQSGVGTRWALGSVADKVSRVVSIPMVLIRADRDRPAVHPKGVLTQILVPLDGSSESESVLPYVIEMAQRLNAEVTFFHILHMQLYYHKGSLPVVDEEYKRSEAYLGKLAADFKNRGIEARFEIGRTPNSIAEEINRFTHNNYMDIIIMATHGHSGPRRWVMGSVTSYILREGNTPIMLIRTPGPFQD